MANTKRPIALMPFPAPEHAVLGTAYKVKDGDNWKSIAAAHRLNVATLIIFNFKTLVPDEINWYLREKVGCRRETPDRANYRFATIDVPGIIFIPKSGPPPCPNDYTKSYDIEVKEAQRTRQQAITVSNRFFRTVGAVGRTGRFIPTIIDTKYWFAKLYEIITGFEIAGARDYRDPGFVLHFIPIFYDLYAKALDGLDAGGASVSPLWQRHFNNTGRPDSSSVLAWSAGVLTSLSTGVSAHIQGDMADALEKAYKSYTKKYCLTPAPSFDTFKDDFFSMGKVFEQGRVAAMSLVSSLGPIPEAGVKIGDAMGMGLSISTVEQWRSDAWDEAKKRLGQK